MFLLFSVVFVIDVDVSICADIADATSIRIFFQFFLVVVGDWIAARAVVAQARHVAAHLRPPAADQHEERLAATGALFLRLTCKKKTERKKKNQTSAPLFFV